MADDRPVAAPKPPRHDEGDPFGGLPPGALVSKYEILAMLGQGGFGITYRARDTQLNRDVALKEYLPTSFAVRRGGVTVLPRSTQTAEDFVWGRDRFLDEARTLARLEEAPGIVNVYDFLQANGTAYMVMALVRGETLEARLKRERRMPQTAIEQMLHPLLDGLEKVHDAGFLHRDIKPANILLSPDGRPTLIDFGASRMALSGRTQAMTAVYTPGYAAFEQMSSGKQGPWTDVYALAATLYGCVAGTPPAPAIDRMAEDRLLPAAEVGKGRYAPTLLAAIDAGMKLKAADRPQSIAAWRRILSGLGDESVGAPTREMVESATRRMPEARGTRHRPAWIAGGIVALAVMGGGAWLALRPPVETPEQALRRIEEDARRQSELAMKMRQEQEAAAAARRKVEDDAARKAADEKAAADATARRQAEEAERQRAAAEAARKAEQDERERAAAAARKAAEDKAAAEAAAQRKAEADERQRVAAAEAARKAAEDRAAAEAAAQRKAAEEKAAADAAARRKAETDERQRIAAEVARQAEEQAARKAAEEKAAAEAATRRQVQEEAQRRAAEEKAVAETAARRRAEEEARGEAQRQREAEIRRETEARVRAEFEARQRAEEQAREKLAAEAAARRREEELRREAEEKARTEVAAREKAEADARRAAEDEARRAAEEKARAEADLKRQAEAAEAALRLSPEDRKRVQVALTALGHNTQGSDGAFGPRTRQMIASWQKSQKAPETGYLTAVQLTTLRQQAAPAIARFDEEQKKVEEDKRKPEDEARRKAEEEARKRAQQPPPATPPQTAAAAPGTAPSTAGPDGRWTGSFRCDNAVVGTQSVTLTISNGSGRTSSGGAYGLTVNVRGERVSADLIAVQTAPTAMTGSFSGNAMTAQGQMRGQGGMQSYLCILRLQRQ